ncbi:MAG: hypothetical protein ACK4R9_05970 [Ignavibacterium sp.]
MIKNYSLWFIILISSLILFASCNKEDEIVNPGNQNKIVLKGNISVLYKNSMIKINGGQNVSSDSTITKVIVFYPYGFYTIANVVDGKFSIEVEKGTPAFMIFAGPNDNYLGFLSLRDGFESIPLVKVSDNVTTIDLQNILLSNKVGSPTHNPLGAEILLSDEEQQILSMFDDFFFPIVRNPDVDGNGKIDLLENKFYRLQVLWFYGGGNFGNNLTPSFTLPLRYDGWKLAFSAQENNAPQSVNFYYPWNPTSASQSEQTRYLQQWNATIYFSRMINESLPIGGTYQINFKNQTLNFVIPDQSQAFRNCPIIVPSITLNSDSSIQKVSWVYYDASGTRIIDPNAFAARVNFGIETFSRNYDSPNVELPTNQFVMNETINWNTVTRVWIAYHDIFDNHYIFFYSK